jgi:hypothetical protein
MRGSKWDVADVMVKSMSSDSLEGEMHAFIFDGISTLAMIKKYEEFEKFSYFLYKELALTI